MNTISTIDSKSDNAALAKKLFILVFYRFCPFDK
jgi:hypothetical protein